MSVRSLQRAGAVRRPAQDLRRITSEARVASELGLPDEQVGFVLRIWLEQSNGASFWRGSVQDIDSGLVSHFQDGPTLLRLLNDRLVARNGLELARSPPGGQRQ
jgi:hypothetical protein